MKQEVNKEALYLLTFNMIEYFIDNFIYTQHNADSHSQVDTTGEKFLTYCVVCFPCLETIMPLLI